MTFPVFCWRGWGRQTRKPFPAPGLLTSSLLCFFQQACALFTPLSLLPSFSLASHSLPLVLASLSSSSWFSSPWSWGMVTQQVKALAALTEDPSSVPTSQMPVIPVPMDPSPSSGFHGYQAGSWYTSKRVSTREDVLNKNKYTSKEKFLLKSSFIMCGSLAWSVLRVYVLHATKLQVSWVGPP